MSPILSARGLAASLALAVAGASFADTSYFIVGHQDDWQLFMGDGAYEDVENANTVVFIYLTAGDAGLKAGGGGSIAYYRAREEGAKDSLRLPMNEVQGTFPAEAWGRVTVNRKNISRWVRKNTVSYFLRLPDGSPSGDGYTNTLNQTLKRFKLGLSPSIAAVDNSATYTSWNELVLTIRAILQRHQGTDPEVWVNTHETDLERNFYTHSDHYYTGVLAQHAGVPIGAKIALWLDYTTGVLAPNIGTRKIINKSGLLGAYSGTMARYGYSTGFDDAHVQWLDRSYVRVREDGEILPQ